MYVLDEPSIGLHQRDNQRLIATLRRLRDLGNSVLVVEHDEETIEAADHVVDFGPGAGRLGGRVVAAARPTQVQGQPGLARPAATCPGSERIEVPDEPPHADRLDRPCRARASTTSRTSTWPSRSACWSRSPASRARASRR